jgi:hypothetical protein
MDNQELVTTKVPRSLEIKSKMFGFELPDLLLIFFNLAITNLIFGTSTFRLPLVWGTTLGMALFLYFVKRGKPDNYLQHLGEYVGSATYRAAGVSDKKYIRFKKERIKNVNKK